MKPERLVLAAALACSGGGSNTACGPGGCWMLPPDFEKRAGMLGKKEEARLESQKSEVKSQKSGDTRDVPQDF